MKVLALLVLLATPTVVLAATVKIGVLVSPTPSLSWMSKQFEVGAELAFARIAEENPDFDYELVRLENDLGSDDAIRALTNDVTTNRITAVIAASTNDSANKLRHLKGSWSTPTIVVTPSDLVASPDDENRNGYVVDLGIPLQRLQSEVVRQWQHCYARDGLTVVFNQDFGWSSTFAKHAASTVSYDAHLATLAWSDAGGVSSHDEVIAKVAQETRNNPEIGIILAGTPWNSTLWINSLARSGVNAPIYVGPYVSSLSKLQQLAATSNSTIFTASKYLTNPADRSQMEFTNAAAEQLGWSQAVPMAPIALQAYDAAAVIASAYAEGRIEPSVSTHWWHGLESVRGIKGTLYHYDDVTLSPPTELLEIRNDGSFTFSPGLGECPR